MKSPPELPVGHVTWFLFPEGAVQALAVTDRTLIKMHCTARLCVTTLHYSSVEILNTSNAEKLTRVIMSKNIHIVEMQIKKNTHAQNLEFIYNFLTVQQNAGKNQQATVKEDKHVISFLIQCKKTF